jgi:phosphatidylserine synthase
LESGIIAAVLLIAILIYPVVKALQSIRYEKFKAQSIDIRPWTISLIVFLIYLLLHNVWAGGQGVVVLCIIAVIIRSIKKLSTNTV